jgi:hypothetical protein
MRGHGENWINRVVVAPSVHRGNFTFVHGCHNNFAMDCCRVRQQTWQQDVLAAGASGSLGRFLRE